jgi:serine/threonine protein kinase
MQPFLNAGEQLGKYRILSFLGAGGMGEVFLGEDPQLGRRVAVKLLPRAATQDSHRRQRFVTEARAASALNHPHIVTIYELGQDGDRDFIAMEYIEGESLRELLRRGSLPLKKAMGIIAQTASALAAAHGAGIVHRDIKPENLMVSRSGDVKVLDYGLAKLAERDSMPGSGSGTTALKTEPGKVMGTVAYMSPEQAEGRPVDHRSDIFSLGVVMYEAVTGKLPFEATSSIEQLHKIITVEPPSPLELNPRLPAGVESVLQRALAKNPEERYQHAGDFRLDLLRLAEQPVATHVSIAPRRQALALLGMLAVGVAAGIALSIATSRLNRAKQRPFSLSNVTVTAITTDPGYEGEPTFSPDGQTIAYVSDRTGNLEIFLKQISGGPDINLTNNPADDTQPAFSPDGKQIVFVSSRDSTTGLVYRAPTTPLMGGDIWVMPAFGGAARRIVRSGNFPSWSPDGSSILYTTGPWRKQRILAVSAQGGTPRAIPIEFEGKHIYVFHPSYCRDARWILFDAQGGPGQGRIYVVAASGGKARLVAKGRRPAWNADSSAIIYSTGARGRNFSLWHVPFSTRKGLVTGEPRPLTVGRGQDTQASPSRDGRYIAFAAQDITFNIEKIPFDAETGRVTGEAEPVTRGSELSYFFNVSPSGKSVVFQSNRGSEFHIWRVDEGSPPVQLTSDPAFEDRFPVWSRDGNQIAFARKEIKSGKSHMSLMSADGSNPQPIFESAGSFMAFSPVGRAIAYFAEREEQVYLFDLDRRTSRRLTSGAGVRSGQSFSPDGKWLVYQSIGKEETTDSRAVPVAGGESIAIMETLHEDFHPIVSPSGRWVYSQEDHKNLFRVPGPAQGWRRAEPVKVTNFPESNLYLDDPQFSPDGKWLFYSRANTRSDLWLLKLRD